MSWNQGAWIGGGFESRILTLEEANAINWAEYWESIASGTSGTLTIPAGHEILLNQWADGVDAVVSQIEGGVPSGAIAFDAGGDPVTTTLDAAGAWAFSAAPTAYPVAIVYASRSIATGAGTGGGNVYVLDTTPSGGDDTTIVQTAIDAAIAAGFRFVRVEDDYDVQSALTDRSNVMFIGPGTLGDVYRRTVIPETAPTGLPEMSSSLEAKIHLPSLNAKTPAVVVLAGDSTAHYFSQALGRSATLQNLLKEKLVREFPDKSITVHNRAVGGQTYNTFVDVPSGNFPAWYTNHLTPWLDYIEALTPDVVFLAFGQNDSTSFDRSNFELAVSTINGWDKVPDIIFFTPLVPSLEIDPGNAFAALSNEANQEGVDYAAGYIRTWAVRNGYGYIDINRAFNIVRDGRDLMNTALKRAVTAEDTTGTGKYTAPDAYKCHDFRLHSYITGSAGAIATKYNNVGNLMSVRTGGDAADRVEISTSGGFIKIELFSGAATVISFVTSTAVPTVAHYLNVEKRGTSLAVFINEDFESAEAFYTGAAVWHGGEFAPVIGYYGLSTGPVDEVTFDMGVEKQYIPSLTNDEVWGASDTTTDQKLPWGGQGINHPTSLAGNAIIYGALEQISMAYGYAASVDYSAPIAANSTGTIYPRPNSHYTSTSAEVTLTSSSGTAEFQPGSGTSRIIWGNGASAAATLTIDPQYLSVGDVFAITLDEGESRTLRFDGTDYTKVDEVFIPMAFHAYNNTNQVGILSATFTALDLNSEVFDSGEVFNTTTDVFQAKRPGLWALRGRVPTRDDDSSSVTLRRIVRLNEISGGPVADLTFTDDPFAMPAAAQLAYPTGTLFRDMLAAEEMQLWLYCSSTDASTVGAYGSATVGSSTEFQGYEVSVW